MNITQLSPIAAGLTGGITVTLTGTGFQTCAAVFFGSRSATQVTVVSSTSAQATLPAASETGSVNVQIVNPDGSMASLPGGFTYVNTNQGGQAEVLDIQPISVLEGTPTQIHIRGYNLIAARDQGLFALRGPSQAIIAASGFTDSIDPSTGIETLTGTIEVTSNPPLEPLDRMAIQVLASRRPGALTDGVAETSRKMFTVFPQAVPVPLAYTAIVNPDGPTLIVIAGRNLEGCMLSLGKQFDVHLQRSEDKLVVGIVSLEASEGSGEEEAGGTSVSGLQVALMDSSDREFARYDLTAAASSSEGGGGESAQTVLALPDAPELPDVLPLTLTPVPDQRIIGPTAEDSAMFNLIGEPLLPIFFDFINFEITIFDITIILPVVNEVHLISLFDFPNDPASGPVLARLGQLFRVRGIGLLVALRVEVTIHISVVLIIGFIFEVWPYGLFNEFPEFGWAIGTVVIGILITIDIFINVSYMTALVLPDGRLQLLDTFNLTLGIDFTISDGGFHLHFEPGFTHRVNFRSIQSTGDLLLCNGRFQLAEDNGVTVFPGGAWTAQAFYFAREEGRCCTSWNFDMDLVRFAPGGSEEVTQGGFDVDFCLRARPTPNLMNIIVTSVPAPTGVPPHLELEVGESAELRAMAQIVDVNGNPTGAPLQDVRDLGYGVKFYVDGPPDVLDPTLLPDGHAFAVLDGNNVIHAEVTAIRIGDDPDNLPAAPEFGFWAGGVIGFNIADFLGDNEYPRIRYGGLPVMVEAVEVVVPPIEITPLLVYTEGSGSVTDALMEIQRAEPFEMSPPRIYTFGVKLTIDASVPLPQTLTFKVNVNSPPRLTPVKPLEIAGAPFAGNRADAQAPTQFFSGTLTQATGQEYSLVITSRPDPSIPLPVPGLTLKPNSVETGSALVPPGFNVGGQFVSLGVELNAQVSNATLTSNTLQLNAKVVHDETFEEYLRVFQEVQTILDPGGQAGQTLSTIRSLPGQLLSALDDSAPNPAEDAIVLDTGRELWNMSSALVKGGYIDDRPLYWVRLQAICAIRAYHRRRNLLGADTAVAEFEAASRGLASLSGTPGNRIAVVTGFDPFGLPSEPSRSNPSGLIALKLKNQPLSSNQGPVEIITAIFPVRYADFDRRAIEMAMESLMSSAIMIITCSDNSARLVYDIERYATRTRGGFVDNLFKSSTNPLGTGSDNYLESTLPYEQVITDLLSTRELPGPTGNPFTDKMSFVLDQSYQLESSNGTPTSHIYVVPPANNMAVPQCYQKSSELPNSGLMRFGSGGSYLSNEIFYRVASLRQAMRRALPTGHFHVVTTGSSPLSNGPKLLEGATIAIQKLLENSSQLFSSGDIMFPPTVVNATSQPITLSVTNGGANVILLTAAQITPPFAVQVSLPILINTNETISLPCTFKPNAVRSFTGNLQLRNSAGDLLLTVALTGEGIAGPNTPKVTGFSPTSGHVGDTVSIAGEHFDGATSVEIGGGPATFTVVSATQIDAVISAQATTGLIKVTTPNGIAFSQTPFTILAGGNNANFVTQTPPPTTMTALQSAAVSVKMHNNGTTVWRAGIHKLGSQNPANNLDWGLNRVPLLADVMPGGDATFNFNVTAPVVPRDYNFQWQMHSSTEFFGATSTNVGVTVNAAFGSAPQPPSGLTATVVSGNQVDLHWNDVADEVGYAIERKASDGTWTQIHQVAANATSMSDQSLSAGTYVYRIRAFNSSGYSAYSNKVVATIGAASPPAAPVDLGAIAGPGLRVTLGWTDKSHDETGFRIERKTAATAFAPIATVGPEVQSFTDTDVAASTTYFYRVKAYRDGLDSTPTNEALATTPGPMPPAAPSDLTATALSITQVDLSWVDNSNNEDGFNIERRTESGPFELVQTVAANVTTVSDFTVWGGTRYLYRVKAFNATGGESDGSNEQEVNTPTSANPPSAPNTLEATPASSTQVNLAWLATSDDQAGFTIERKIGSADFAVVGVTPPSPTSFSDTGLQPATTYTYRVKAFNDAGESGYSEEVNATTPTLQTGCQASLVSGDGVYGYVEGVPSAARWRTPLAGVMAIDPLSSQPALFIADSENHRIRMILLAGANAGQSVLIAGDGTAELSDGGGNPLAARYNGPRGIAAFTNENGVVTSLIIADTNNHALRKLAWDAGWKPATISSNAGIPDLLDSTTPSQCKYNAPEGIVVALDGFAYVADTGNGAIRKVDQTGVATTRVAKGVILTPSGITASGRTGELYISDRSANKIWKVTGNSVTWLAGSGAADFGEGIGTDARFNAPAQLAWASTYFGEFIYIADRGNNRIRKLALITNGVTTLAGSGLVGYSEGACATAAFNAPRGVAVGSGGDVYVVDSGNNRIRKVR